MEFSAREKDFQVYETARHTEGKPAKLGGFDSSARHICPSARNRSNSLHLLVERALHAAFYDTSVSKAWPGRRTVSQLLGFEHHPSEACIDGCSPGFEPLFLQGNMPPVYRVICLEFPSRQSIPTKNVHRIISEV